MAWGQLVTTFVTVTIMGGGIDGMLCEVAGGSSTPCWWWWTERILPITSLAGGWLDGAPISEEGGVCIDGIGGKLLGMGGCEEGA